MALRRVPEANSSWQGDHIRQFNEVHINVAVSADVGLLTPIIRSVDTLGLADIF